MPGVSKPSQNKAIYRVPNFPITYRHYGNKSLLFLLSCRFVTMLSTTDTGSWAQDHPVQSSHAPSSQCRLPRGYGRGSSMRT